MIIWFMVFFVFGYFSHKWKMCNQIKELNKLSDDINRIQDETVQTTMALKTKIQEFDKDCCLWEIEKKNIFLQIKQIKEEKDLLLDQVYRLQDKCQCERRKI